MKKSIFLLAFFSFGIFTKAQHLHQVLILNEGNYDYVNNEIIEPVSIGVYNPAENTYNEVLELTDMRFGSDIVIDNDFYYVAADTKIYKIDLNTHQIVGNVTCEGVRNLCVYNGKVYATRGEYLVSFDSYFHVYDANDLSLLVALDTVEGPKWSTQNILSFEDKIYFVINNAYEWGNEKGLIGVYNANTMSYDNEIDLGSNATNPDNLFLYNGSLFTVNNKDWSGASISKLSLDLVTNETVNISNASTGCGTSALRDNKLIYQISMENTLNEFDIELMNNVGPLSANFSNFYELAQDPVSGYFYASETDYISYGKVKVYNENNVEINNFDTGVSPGTIVFDVRFNGGVSDPLQNVILYPNPTNEVLHIQNSLNSEYIIKSINGNELIKFKGSSVNVSALNKGIYILESESVRTTFVKN